MIISLSLCFPNLGIAYSKEYTSGTVSFTSDALFVGLVNTNYNENKYRNKQQNTLPCNRGSDYQNCVRAGEKGDQEA